MKNRYPLEWPTGWQRTPSYRRHKSRYSVSLDTAMKDLQTELGKLGASDVLLSTNLETRLDGKPYAGRSEPRDPGVALYWKKNDRQHVMPSDAWETVRENVRALGLAIGAFNLLERTRTGQILERATSGFLALPPPPDWRVLLGFKPGEVPSLKVLTAAYRKRSKAARENPSLTLDLNLAFERAKHCLAAGL